MPKECIHTLSDSIQASSEAIVAVLGKLDTKLLARIKELPAEQRLDFYEWASKNLNSDLISVAKK